LKSIGLSAGFIVKLGVGNSVRVWLISIGFSTGFIVKLGVGLAVITAGLLDGFGVGRKKNVGRDVVGLGLGLGVGFICLSGVVNLRISTTLFA